MPTPRVCEFAASIITPVCTGIILGTGCYRANKRPDLRMLLPKSFRRIRYGLRSLNSGSNPLSRYIKSAPSPQNALDIFKGQWWSSFPEPFGGLQAGQL